MRYSDIENVNLGHRQISFGFENNLSQEQNATDMLFIRIFRICKRN